MYQAQPQYNSSVKHVVLHGYHYCPLLRVENSTPDKALVKGLIKSGKINYNVVIGKL